MPQDSKTDFKDPDTALLRELLNRRPQGRDPLDAIGNPELPSVPHPGGFRPDPLVIGTPRLGKAVNKLHQIAPELRGRVDLISTAPTPGLIERMAADEINPMNSNNLNLLGQYIPKQKGVSKSEIWLRNENKYPMDEALETTLTHEMGHVGNKRQHGYLFPRDTDMDMIEMLGSKVLGAPHQKDPLSELMQALDRAGVRYKVEQ